MNANLICHLWLDGPVSGATAAIDTDIDGVYPSGAVDDRTVGRPCEQLRSPLIAERKAP